MKDAITTGSSLEDQVGQIADEFVERLKRGEKPTIEEYAQRHPELAEMIRRVFPGLLVIRNLTGGALDLAAEPMGGASCSSSVATEPSPPLRGILGDFHIQREIGRGGMGIVYEAQQISLDRRVALKVLPFASTLDPKQLQRFKNEAQAAAHLHHQSIVQVYATGCERGVHYYAMQFIEGQTLAQMILELRTSNLESKDLQPTQDRPVPNTPQAPKYVEPPSSKLQALSFKLQSTAVALTTDRSITSRPFFRTVGQLGIQAAEALEHAHQLGVIHRDIKPANLLIDGQGMLSITDFGLAHCQSQAGLTMSGDLLGTLRYMSPEQALAKRVAVDQRTDIYSLGATLYELLTLEPAFNGRDRQEVLRQIAFEEPRLPTRLNRAIPAELETIVLKAMGKNPEERYSTAKELADDLGRFLGDKPIKARRATLLQRAKKWARRHSALVTTAAVFVVLLLVGAVVGLAVSNSIIQREKSLTSAKNAELERSLYCQKIARIDRERSAGNIGLAERLLEECKEELRCWEWYYQRRLRYGPTSPLPVIPQTWRLAVSADGRRLALGVDGGPIRIVDLRNLQEIISLNRRGENLLEFAFSPDGRLLGSATGGPVGEGPPDSLVEVWDTETWKPLHAFRGGEAEFESVAFSPDGRCLVAGTVQGTIRAWDLTSDRELPPYEPGQRDITSVAFSPDGRRLAAAGESLTVLDTASRAIIFSRPIRNPARVVVGDSQVVFSPDGRYLATCAGDFYRDSEIGHLIVWEAASGELLHELRGHTGMVASVAFSPDSRRLASAGFWDRNIKLWDVATGQEMLTLRGHSGAVFRVVFSPDGNRLFTLSNDHTLRIWDATPLEEIQDPAQFTLAGHLGRVNNIAFSPDDRYLASAGLDGRVKLWDATTGLERITVVAKRPVLGLAFSPDGKRLASISFGTLASGVVSAPQDESQASRVALAPASGAALALGGEVQVWEVQTGRGLLTLPCRDGLLQPLGVTFSPDGRWLAWAEDHDVLMRDAATGALVRTLLGPPSKWVLNGVAFSADGRQLAGTRFDGSVDVWDLSAAAPAFGSLILAPASLGPGASPLAPLLFRVWSATSIMPVRSFQAHEGSAYCVAFNKDSTLLVTASLDGLVKVWDTRTWKLRHTLTGHPGGTHGISFSRTRGDLLATGGQDGVVRLWDASKGKELSTLYGHKDAVYSVAFSGDGRIASSGSGMDQTVKVWRLPGVRSP